MENLEFETTDGATIQIKPNYEEQGFVDVFDETSPTISNDDVIALITGYDTNAEMSIGLSVADTEKLGRYLTELAKNIRLQHKKKYKKYMDIKIKEAMFPNMDVDYPGKTGNLLINGNFKINQRGRKFIPVDVDIYTSDRWMTDIHSEASSAEYICSEYGLQIIPTTYGKTHGIQQRLLDGGTYKGATVSFTVNIDDEIYSATFIIPSSAGSTVINEINDLVQLSISCGETDEKMEYICAHIILKNMNEPKVIRWANLQLGEGKKLFTAREFSEEFALCNYFYRNIKGVKLNSKGINII